MLRRSSFLLFITIAAELTLAASRPRSKLDQDAWVRGRVNAFVRAARAVYARDEAIPRYQRILNSMSRTIRARKLDEDASFVSRYREFVDYVRTVSLDRLPGHELGFEIPDKQYFAETSKYVQIPEVLLEPAFLRSVTRYETLNRAKDFLRRINQKRAPGDRLLFFSYTSRHLGTPDNDDSYRRLLIVVPGDSDAGVPEKWVQFGVTDPRVRNPTRNLSVVSAMINRDGTFNTYFKDYFRTYRRHGLIGIKGRWESGWGDDFCASCHKSGVLPIFPEPGSVSAAEEPEVEAVNARFTTYGSPRFGGYLDASAWGPGLGSATAKERSKRFGQGFADTAVGRAMSCSQCHQSSNLGSLNWPFNEAILSSYIKGGHMPPGVTLTQSQRDELYDKLLEEYFSVDEANPGILKAWLTGRLR